METIDSKQLTVVVNLITDNKDKEQDIVQKALENALIKSKEVFETIGYFQSEFEKDETRSIDFYVIAQDRLTGCYMYLSPIVSVLKAVVLNRYSKFFHHTKLEFEKNPPQSVNAKGILVNEKFVTAPVEKEADNFVSFERYVLAAFSGFLDSCLMGIQTCRSRIKEQNEEMGMNS